MTKFGLGLAALLFSTSVFAQGAAVGGSTGTGAGSAGAGARESVESGQGGRGGARMPNGAGRSAQRKAATRARRDRNPPAAIRQDANHATRTCPVRADVTAETVRACATRAGRCGPSPRTHEPRPERGEREPQHRAEHDPRQRPLRRGPAFRAVRDDSRAEGRLRIAAIPPARGGRAPERRSLCPERPPAVRDDPGSARRLRLGRIPASRHDSSDGSAALGRSATWSSAASAWSTAHPSTGASPSPPRGAVVTAFR